MLLLTSSINTTSASVHSSSSQPGSMAKAIASGKAAASTGPR
jgi:hypothetical protein